VVLHRELELAVQMGNAASRLKKIAEGHIKETIRLAKMLIVLKEPVVLMKLVRYIQTKQVARETVEIGREKGQHATKEHARAHVRF